MTRKTPEQTRTKLLEAAAQIILTQGAAHLTLDQVAQDAGISKGGLLHHFPTKEALLIGLMQRSFDLFQRRIERHRAGLAAGAGQWLRAYILTTFEQVPEEEALTAALLMLAANSPAIFAAKQSELTDLAPPTPYDGLPPARFLAIQLACDGLWFSESSGMVQLDAAARAALQAELLQLVDTKPPLTNPPQFGEGI